MKDNFSEKADQYARYRPGYPKELFDFVLSHTKGRRQAWDCGTGNGQTALVLADYFETVVATDISQKQLDNAERRENILYSLQPAEKTNLPPDSMDLVTVSQALHWFRFDDFYEEVRRVLRRGGIIAVWTYSLLSISQEVDEIVGRQFYKEILGDYWDAERRFVDEKYQTVPFPFDEIATPPLHISYRWTLEELIGYLGTWSGLQKYRTATAQDPLPEVASQLRRVWQWERMDVHFPLYLRMGSA